MKKSRFSEEKIIVSVRRACEAVGLTPPAFYAPRRPKDDGPVIAAIERYVQENPAHGFDKSASGAEAAGLWQDRAGTAFIGGCG